MAFRDKARGPLGWILGVVGGLALLLGSFFAGMATADTSVDQEQASVTEQQEDTRGQDADGNTDSNTGSESQDQEQDQNSGQKPDRDADDADPEGSTEEGGRDGRHGSGGPGCHGDHGDHDGNGGADDQTGDTNGPAGESAPEQDEPAA